MGKVSNDTRTAIIKEYSEEYGTLTDDQADNSYSALAGTTDIEQTKLRQRYCRSFDKSLARKRKQGDLLSNSTPPHQP